MLWLYHEYLNQRLNEKCAVCAGCHVLGRMMLWKMRRGATAQMTGRRLKATMTTACSASERLYKEPNNHDSMSQDSHTYSDDPEHRFESIREEASMQ